MERSLSSWTQKYVFEDIRSDWITLTKDVPKWMILGYLPLSERSGSHCTKRLFMYSLNRYAFFTSDANGNLSNDRLEKEFQRHSSTLLFRHQYRPSEAFRIEHSYCIICLLTDNCTMNKHIIQNARFNDLEKKVS